MRSDAIDQMISQFFKLPARVSWEGALADSARGQFEKARLELAGVAILALPFERLVVEADRFQFAPGIPARISAVGPRITVSVDQRQLDQWLARARAPFELTLEQDSIGFRVDVAGIPITRTETELTIRDGWFILRSKRAEFLGFQTRLTSLFRTFLPLPRLAPQTRLTQVEHAPGLLRLTLTLDDFEDEITPGLLDRLQSRFLPFARIGIGRKKSEPAEDRAKRSDEGRQSTRKATRKATRKTGPA